MDLLFKAIVLPNIVYGLSVYAAIVSDLSFPLSKAFK